MNFDELLSAARKVRESAYAPYSRFHVGTALRKATGRIFCGCNVEKLSFGLTICTERAAAFAAAAVGETKFEAIAVVADSIHPVTPCGAYRQVLAGFSTDLEISSANLQGQRYEATIAELLPRARAGILGS